jgi:hypothetical protein
LQKILRDGVAVVPSPGEIRAERQPQVVAADSDAELRVGNVVNINAQVDARLDAAQPEAADVDERLVAVARDIHADADKV